MKNTNIFILLSLLSIIIFSCAKDGETGPQGKPGNANIQTYTFAVDTNQWQFGTVTHNMPELTKSVLDSGLVQVYFRDAGEVSWTALPFDELHYPKSCFLCDPDYVSTYYYILLDGGIRIIKQDNDYPLFGRGSPTNKTFKVVLAPKVGRFNGDKRSIGIVSQ